MRTSERRILTTHAGSLPRPDRLTRLLIERDHEHVVDINALRALAPIPRAPVPRPSRHQPSRRPPRWSRRHSAH